MSHNLDFTVISSHNVLQESFCNSVNSSSHVAFILRRNLNGHCFLLKEKFIFHSSNSKLEENLSLPSFQNLTSF